MSLIVNAELCTACGVCESVCPFGAIAVNGDVAEANEKCTLCGSCEDACPTGAITIERKAIKADDSYQGVWVFAEQRQGIAESGCLSSYWERAGSGRQAGGASGGGSVYGRGPTGAAEHPFRIYGRGTGVYLAEDACLAGFTERPVRAAAGFL
jgi:NAD-dependent dihydropyrimidine dehydrogenase PreA subunit